MSADTSPESDSDAWDWHSDSPPAKFRIFFLTSTITIPHTSSTQRRSQRYSLPSLTFGEVQVCRMYSSVSLCGHALSRMMLGNIVLDYGTCGLTYYLLLERLSVRYMSARQGAHESSRLAQPSSCNLRPPLASRAYTHIHTT